MAGTRPGGVCEGWVEGEGEGGSRRGIGPGPRLPEDLPPPTLAKASISRIEKKKNKK